MQIAKTYLGDAVYAEIDVWGRLVLTTEDGIRATNRIVLEGQVWRALVAYMERAQRWPKRGGDD